MNNLDLYKYVNFIVSEDAYGNTFNPSEFDNLLKILSISYHQRLVLQYEADKIQTHSIRRFKTDSTQPVVDGLASLPADYHYLSTALAQYESDGEYKYSVLPILSDEAFALRLKSPIKRATEKNPFCRIKVNKLEVLPEIISFVRVMYIRKPLVPNFVLTLDADDNPTVYTSQSIVELDFEDYDKIKIAHEILSLRGVNLKEPNLVQFAEILKQQENDQGRTN